MPSALVRMIAAATLAALSIAPGACGAMPPPSPIAEAATSPTKQDLLDYLRNHNTWRGSA